MPVEALFPSFIFYRNFLDKKLSKHQGLTQEQIDMCVKSIDEMRRNDPHGRAVSNRGGWQSNDGCESEPTFVPVMKRIVRFMQDEILPFHGFVNNEITPIVGNSWANVNQNGTYNAPHLHNGCWYSGVFYLKAEGDEGDIVFMDKDPKFVSNFPSGFHCETDRPNNPRTGEIILFPSGLMHMVEPNYSDRERYSISFNIDYQVNIDHKIGQGIVSSDAKSRRLLFDVTSNGNIKFHK
jgi:uncharacterized protein (TIGR02466 family)